METRRASYITVCSHVECVVEGVWAAIPGQMKNKESGPHLNVQGSSTLIQNNLNLIEIPL